MLEAGKQKLVMLSARSPVEIYMTTVDKFQSFLETQYDILERDSDYVHIPKPHQVYLVVVSGLWHRAEVIQAYREDGKILIKLLDFPKVLEVEGCQLRQAPKAAVEIPLMAVKCALDCFYGKEEEAIKQVEKFGYLPKDYNPHDGEVLGCQDGLTRVKIPDIESKLMEVTKSNREPLLMRLKNLL